MDTSSLTTPLLFIPTEDPPLPQFRPTLLDRCLAIFVRAYIARKTLILWANSIAPEMKIKIKRLTPIEVQTYYKFISDREIAQQREAFLVYMTPKGVGAHAFLLLKEYVAILKNSTEELSERVAEYAAQNPTYAALYDKLLDVRDFFGCHHQIFPIPKAKTMEYALDILIMHSQEALQAAELLDDILMLPEASSSLHLLLKIVSTTPYDEEQVGINRLRLFLNLFIHLLKNPNASSLIPEIVWYKWTRNKGHFS